MSLMVSISGIRGIVGETLSPEIIKKYCFAFAKYSKFGTIIIGRDGRQSGKEISNTVAKYLTSAGCTVIDLGIVPTPTVQIAVEHLHANGGISITASHNPNQWNGMKFISRTGMFLNADENKIFWDIAENDSIAESEIKGDHVFDASFIERHISAILNLPQINLEQIRNKKFKVALDCVNAAGGIIVPALLEKFGCEIIPINCDVSGIFSHTPEPIPENLTALCDLVKKEKADFGIAVDPDVDRLVLINEFGEPFVEEYTVTSVIDFILNYESKQGRNFGSVAVNLSTTRAVDDVAKKYGAQVFRTAVGEINVATLMKKENCVIGGEGSGGVIFPELHIGRDAIVGIGLFLQYLTESNKSASELKKALPQYFISKGKIDFTTGNANKILKIIEEKYCAENITTIDGVKIDFADSWVHLRASNTEPIIRIIAEAKSIALANSLVDIFKTELTSHF
ncbi:MAG: phosphoglucosamine mutase [Bacteroidota bacterium]